MINIGIPVSYDHDLAHMAIRYVYPTADKIYIAIDAQRNTWTGKKITIPQSFFAEINKMDAAKKIVWYEDDFYSPALMPLQNETRERLMLAAKMGKGWHVQIDCDEYIYSFEKVTGFLKKNNFISKIGNTYPMTFVGRLVTLFKQVAGGFLYIENNEPCPFITNCPQYNNARDAPQRFFDIETIVIHQSWARDEKAIEKKINNWGHAADFDTATFLTFWKSLNEINYREVKNFHPLVPQVWNELKYLPCKDVSDFITQYRTLHPQRVKDPFSILDKAKIIIKNVLNIKIEN